MHYIRIHQHIEKNSVPLKEVLTRRCERVSRARVGSTSEHVHGDASKAWKREAFDCQYRRKCPRCRRFRHSRIDDRNAFELDATCRCRLEATRADSESRLLAMKKFSRLTAPRRIAARQIRFLARIAAADSTARLPVALIYPLGQTPRHSGARASTSPESITTDSCRQRHSGPSFAQINVRGYGFRACAKRRIPE
jgi:hypothetical protein